MAWKQLQLFVTELRQAGIDAVEKGTRDKWSTFRYKSIDDMLAQIGDPTADQKAWDTLFKAKGRQYSPQGLATIKHKIDLTLATRRDVRTLYGAADPVRPRAELDYYRLGHNSKNLAQARINDMVKGLGV